MQRYPYTLTDVIRVYVRSAQVSRARLHHHAYRNSGCMPRVKALGRKHKSGTGNCKHAPAKRDLSREKASERTVEVGSSSQARAPHCRECQAACCSNDPRIPYVWL